MKTIAVVSPLEVPYNLQKVLRNLGELVNGRFDLELISGKIRNKNVEGKYKYIFNYEDESSKRFRKLASSSLSLLFYTKMVSKYLRRRNPDVIINSGQQYPLGTAVSLSSYTRRTKSIVRITGNYMDHYKIGENNSVLTRAAKKLFHNELNTKIYNTADKITVVGNNLKGRASSVGIKKKKIEVVPQPFIGEDFQEAPDDEKISEKEICNLDINKVVVLFVGKTNRIKGIDRVVNIYKEVTEITNKYQFCIVGGGEYLNCLKEMESECLKIVGPVDHSNVGKYFRASDLFIYPTRHDALPNVVLEAIKSKTPIMASPVGEIPFYVSNVSSSIDEYVEYILSGQWEPEEPPSWFDIEYQRKTYCNLFAGM